MTLLPAALILVARGGDRQAQGDRLRLRRDHAPRRRRHLDRDPAARPGGTRSAIRPRSSSGSGLQTAIALAALVGMGTKAGVMPLHVWLPRAHPIAPAPVSALMSGVMIKVAIYGLVRVLVEWVGILPVWFGVLVLGVGALSAVGGVVYALFQHDLKRLLALHSIENVGIIVLGLGACLVLRARGADEWAAFALARGAAAHAQPRGLQGAALPRRGRVRAGGRLARARPARRPAAAHAVDRRRVPRRRDGDRGPAAAERLRLGVAHPAGAAPRPGLRRRGRRHRGCGRAGGARGHRGARRLLLRQGRRPRAARPAAPRGPRRWRRRVEMRAAVVVLAGACVVLGLAPGLLFGSLVGLAPWPAAAPTHVGLELPGHGLAAHGRESPSRSSPSRPGSSCCAAGAARRPRRPGRAGSSWSLGCGGRAPGSRSRCG